MAEGMTLTTDGKLYEFQRLEEKDYAKMGRDWEDEPLIPHVYYARMDKKTLEKELPDVEKLMEAVGEEGIDSNWVDAYVRRAYPRETRETGKKRLKRVLSSIVHVDDENAVLRYVALSVPKICIHQNLGEEGGKIILAEEMAHLTQAMKLRLYAKKLDRESVEKTGEEANIPARICELDAIPEALTEGIDAEDKYARELSRHYGQKENTERFLPPEKAARRKAVTMAVEAGADWVRGKTAEELYGWDALLGSNFTVAKLDPIYFRVEEKMRKDKMKRGMKKKKAEKAAKEFVLGQLYLPVALKSKNLYDIDGLEKYQSKLEKKIAHEKKMNLIDAYAMMGGYIALTLGLGMAGIAPFGTAMMKTGGLAYMPLVIGMRSLRRLPVKIKRDLEASKSPYAKAVLRGGKRFSKGASKFFRSVDDGLEELDPYVVFKKKFKRALSGAGNYISRGMGRAFAGGGNGKLKKFAGKADIWLNRVTSNRWNGAKKQLTDKLRIYKDIFMTGLIPIPGTDKVIDIYWQVSNKTVKRKFTPKRARESFGEVAGAMESVGIDKELLEELRKYEGKIEVLDPKELKIGARGFMRLEPKYIFNELLLPFRREE